MINVTFSSCFVMTMHVQCRQLSTKYHGSAINQGGWLITKCYTKRIAILNLLICYKQRRHMKKNLYTILSVLLIAMLSTSTVYAGGLKLYGAFSIGSLIFSGSATGLGNTDVTIVINAIGA